MPGHHLLLAAHDAPVNFVADPVAVRLRLRPVGGGAESGRVQRQVKHSPPAVLALAPADTRRQFAADNCRLARVAQHRQRETDKGK